MRRVISASRLVRNTGAVPVFGFTRAKSSGASGKQRSGSLTVSVSCMKNAHSVSSNRRFAPPNISAQNLNESPRPGRMAVDLFRDDGSRSRTERTPSTG